MNNEDYRASGRRSSNAELESQVDDTNSRHVSPDRVNENKSGKGKSKRLSAITSLQLSGRMAIGTVAIGPSLTGMTISGDKNSTGLGNQWNNQQSPQKNGEMSNQQERSATTGILRTAPTNPPSSEDFSRFVAASQESHTLQTVAQQSLSTAVAEQEALDGLAVLQVLSQPDEFPAAEISQDSESLSPAAVAKLHEALFEPLDRRPAWNNLLDFTPDFLDSPKSIHHGMHMYLGIKDPVVAKSTWLLQWHEILSSYSDSVWGDLGQLADMAQHEIAGQLAQPHRSTSHQNAKALARLQAILVHVRGYK